MRPARHSALAKRLYVMRVLGLQQPASPIKSGPPLCSLNSALRVFSSQWSWRRGRRRGVSALHDTRIACGSDVSWHSSVQYGENRNYSYKVTALALLNWKGHFSNAWHPRAVSWKRGGYQFGSCSTWEWLVLAWGFVDPPTSIIQAALDLNWLQALRQACVPNHGLISRSFGM